ncbi:MAG TPA: NAD(P)-dependent oxidoreductase [Kiritimatiellia bacterium]|nr:NAD(P)-dependent oxidoreductase [Kiritimatiellia bacterium]HMO99112.1 NAD(P)-dependent oxidoreductase [Kiritimatiellia bacterium]HMP97936.1 NAD(P)-dependent oxidoreductase [Kiritimatiellia bacterium]
MNDQIQPPAPRHPAVPIGLVTTCRTLLIIGIGRDIGPRIRHARLFDWYRIHVMWPTLPDELVALTEGDERFVLHRRGPTEEDIARADVIIEDCEDPALAQNITDWSRKHRRLINAIDKPELCDLYYMSLIFRDPLIVAITSGGDAPALAALLRRQLEEKLSPGWSTASRIMAETRQRLPSGQARKSLLLSLARHPDLLRLIESNDEAGLKELFDDAVYRL